MIMQSAKRISAVLLALLMVLTSLSVGVAAEETGGGIEIALEQVLGGETGGETEAGAGDAAQNDQDPEAPGDPDPENDPDPEGGESEGPAADDGDPVAQSEPEDGVAVDGVSIDGGSVRSLGIGQSLQLYHAVSPRDADNTAVSWTSMNPLVASVSSGGVVKGIKTGVAIISATTADGGYRASVTVNVRTAKAAVAYPYLSDLRVNGETVAHFQSGGFAYAAAIPANSVPEIEAVPVDADAEVLVELPDSYPGTAKIEVSVGGESRTYTVELRVEGGSDLPVARAKTGTYEGFVDEDTGVLAFRGIRFATAERWQAPQGVTTTTEDYIPAKEFGDMPLQGSGTSPRGSEDCLNLNIYAADLDTPDKAVMVWIYGGAQIGGSNQNANSQGQNLVLENPDVISVTINHRVGYAGSIDLSALEGYDPELYQYSNNVSRLDIVEALRWVSENIEAFGGDPNNVTLYGQSAGSNNITALMLMDPSFGATDYFQKAICESSFTMDISLTQHSDALIQANAFFEEAEVRTMEEALALSPQELLAAQSRVSAASTSGSSAFEGVQSKLLSPPIDNVVIKEDYFEQLLAGTTTSHLQVIFGTNAGEYDQQYTAWTAEEDWEQAKAFTADQNWGKLRRSGVGSDYAEEIFEAILANKDRDDSYGYHDRSDFTAYKDMKNDLYLRIGAVMFAEAMSRYTDVYMYYFEYHPNPNNAGQQRAAHGSEVAMVFGNMDAATKNIADEDELAIRQAWVNFARSGDPNNDYLDEQWLTYDGEHHRTMVLAAGEDNDQFLLVEGVKLADLEVLMPLYREYPLLMGEEGKISRPGVYEGYSKAEYDGFNRYSRYVEVRDGTQLAVDYYIPTKGGVEETAPLPTIFHFTPYNRAALDPSGRATWTKDGVSVSADGFYLHQYGYAFVVADVRGTGASYGTRDVANSPTEATDGHDIIEWIAAQPFSNGKIGSVGSSYTGQTQLEFIHEQPEHLVASFVGMTDYNKYDGWVRGGVPRAFGSQPDTIWGDSEAEIQATIDRITASTVPVDGDPDRIQLREAVGQHVHNGLQIPMFQKLLWRNSHSEDSGGEYWNQVSASSYKDEINGSGVAIYCIGGNYDVFRRDTFVLYQNLTVPKKMAIDTLYHTDAKTGLWPVEMHRWFDYWLRDIDNGVMNEQPIYIKTASYNFDTASHRDEGTGEYAFYDSWSAAIEQGATLYLAPGVSLSGSEYDNGQLVADARSWSATQAYRTVYGISTSVETRLTTDGTGNGVDQQGMTFTTAPLAQDAEIIGHPMATLRFSLTEAGWMEEDLDLDFFVTLSDYNPETGEAFQFSDGHLRASLRATAEPPYDFLGLPWHENNEGSNEYLELGEVYELEIDLMPVAYKLPAGHSIRVTIANSCDRMYYLGRSQYEADQAVQAPLISLYLGGAADCRIVLPNLDGTPAPAPSTDLPFEFRTAAPESDAPITRGELAVQLAALLNLSEQAANPFSDLDGSEPYADAVLRCVAAGILSPNGTVRAGDVATREETVVMLARAFALGESAATAPFGDMNRVSGWAVGPVNAMYEAGALTVFGDTLLPGSDCLLSEYSAMASVLARRYLAANTAAAGTGTYVGRVADSGVVTYSGIRYATAERWQLPELAAPSDLVRPATAAAIIPVQSRYNPQTQSEEDLSLTIYVNPASQNPNKAVLVRSPVGGGTGSNSNNSDGSVLVQENPDVIVVVVNSRVSYFGCINLTAFDDYEQYEELYQYSNNLIRTDFLHGLRWLQDNIGAFGGDPDNITVFGQSAGAGTVSSMMLIPGATDYFRNVIMQSGVAIDRISLATWDESLEAADKFREFTGVSTIREALELDPQTILDAQAYLSAGAIGAYLPDSQSKMFTTVIDNLIVHDNYWDQIVYAAGEAGVRIMAGSTNGEYDRDLMGLGEQAALEAIVSANWGKLDPARGGSQEAPAIIQGYVDRGAAQYGRDTITSYKDLKNDINQKVSAVIISEAFAPYGSAYLYSYEWYAPNANGLRATHGADNGVIWGTSADAPAGMQVAMRRAWANFALYGDPNTDNAEFRAADVTWRPYDTQNNWTMVFDAELRLDAGQRVDDIEALMPLFAEYGMLRPSALAA